MIGSIIALILVSAKKKCENFSNKRLLIDLFAKQTYSMRYSNQSVLSN